MNRKTRCFAAKWFRKGLFLLLFPLSIPVGTASAVASGKLVRWNIYGQEETIGVITRTGFPIWYTEVAPGYSNIYGGIYFDRLKWNILWWIAFWIIFLLAVPVVRKRFRQNPTKLPCWIVVALYFLRVLASVYLGYVFSMTTGYSFLVWLLYSGREPGFFTHFGFPIWYFHFGPTLPDGMVYFAWREGLNTVFWTIAWLALFFSKLLWRTPATNQREEPK